MKLNIKDFPGWFESTTKDLSGKEYPCWRCMQEVTLWVDGEVKACSVKTEVDVMLVQYANTTVGAAGYLENEKACMRHALLEWILEETAGQEVKCPVFDLDTTRKTGIHTELKSERFAKVMAGTIGLLDRINEANTKK